MDFSPYSHPDRHLPKSAHPLGTIVFCIHCFKTLGMDTPTTPRAKLLAKHSCAESLLAKQPGAPPPYN
jgi:hypothetical protein